MQSSALLKLLSSEACFDINRVRNALGLENASGEKFISRLPFSSGDVTSGCENEFQTAVHGSWENVDLPKSILESNYYQNILKRTLAGEMPKRVIHAFESYLNDNSGQIWENSWVRFRRSVLSQYAMDVFNSDLLADKTKPTGHKRQDADKFIQVHNGEEYLRIPISYLLKLALADAVSFPEIHPMIRGIGNRFMRHFLNDNTSPETYSFYPSPLTYGANMGEGVARETLLRFLLCQSLLAYANLKFELKASGQEALLYFAPHPPIRQKALNNLISDAFYRELFMSPCLSGWDRGEDKYRYMNLCHQVMSRSQLNVIRKLKDAGIISANLVVLPNTSNISLANNGTHVTLGSLKLTNLLKSDHSSFRAEDEKYMGDLAIKIVEHFLPLFVGTYSAAPYRLDFQDFHPETVLGFLPHELDFTHLRMIWRRWRKKANLKILGQPVTPFGPGWLDKNIARIFRLRGDFVNDFRLIDYLVAIMSTDQSPALDGRLGNDARLLKDLCSLGIFDTGMSPYLLYRQRMFSKMGFAGFEGRHYSSFESIEHDLAEAVAVQTLVTCLAYKYILQGGITHNFIPDNPSVESERRQIFFGRAIGIPTFFVKRDTPNLFLLRILQKAQRTRLSHRYPGYIRVYHLEYQRALLKIIQEDASDLIEMMGLKETIKKLAGRIEFPQTCSAAGKLTGNILKEAGVASPMKLSGEEFNSAAEKYYRQTLRKKNLAEAFDQLLQTAEAIDNTNLFSNEPYCEALGHILGKRSAAVFIERCKFSLIEERADLKQITTFIYLLLLVIQHDIAKTAELTACLQAEGSKGDDALEGSNLWIGRNIGGAVQ